MEMRFTQLSRILLIIVSLAIGVLLTVGYAWHTPALAIGIVCYFCALGTTLDAIRAWHRKRKAHSNPNA